MTHGGCFFCKSTTEPVLTSGVPSDPALFAQLKHSIAVCSKEECRAKVSLTTKGNP